MGSLSKILLAAGLGAGVVAASTVSAWADIACSGRVCWHVRDSYDYPARAHVVVHPEGWRWGPREHFTFREHEGRGYWGGGRWRAW